MEFLTEFACKIELRKYACWPIYNIEMLHRRMEAAKSRSRRQHSMCLNAVFYYRKGRLIMDIVYNKQISVIMPLYNAERYLKETLDSVLAQTFHDFELICINDTSTDHTVDILKEYQKKDNRIVILENRERMGAAEARNKGMSSAKGKYLVFLDGDDIYQKNIIIICWKNIMRKCLKLHNSTGGRI